MKCLAKQGKKRTEDDLPKVGKKDVVVIHVEERLLDYHLAQLVGVHRAVRFRQNERANGDFI